MRPRHGHDAPSMHRPRHGRSSVFALSALHGRGAAPRRRRSPHDATQPRRGSAAPATAGPIRPRQHLRSEPATRRTRRRGTCTRSVSSREATVRTAARPTATRRHTSQPAPCEGQVSCAYRVDYKVIGDAAPTAAGRTTVAEIGAAATIATVSQRGGGARRPASTATVPAQLRSGRGGRRAAAAGAATSAARAAPPSRRARAIRVVAGSYGQNCRAARGNVTPHLQQLCEGHSSCTYRVDYKVIGDLAYGCRKDYVAAWRCGDDPVIRRSDRRARGRLRIDQRAALRLTFNSPPARRAARRAPGECSEVERAFPGC